MPKKISEMTQEELQDYALQLEQDVQARTTELAEEQARHKELQGLNLSLQKRNKELFSQLEQQGNDPDDDGNGGNDPEQPPKSCEDVAKELTGSIIK